MRNKNLYVVMFTFLLVITLLSSVLGAWNPNLTAYYKFNDDINDSIGIHNLTGGGGNGFAVGKLNQARDYAGSNADSSSIQKEDFNLTYNPFSIIFWMNTTSNAYISLIETPELASTYAGFTPLGANSIMYWLPVWTTIIGFVGAIILFIRMRQTEVTGYG
jgi:hypothetical protein